MKMNRDDFNALRAAIAKRFTWNDYSEMSARYRARGLSAERFRWDMLAASGFDTARLYKNDLNDSNIDTALRMIFYTLDQDNGAAPAYSETAVNKAIAASNRAGQKISAKEARAIHRLLKGRY